MEAKRASAPTWETVRYMVSAIQYGGRITDEFDKLLMDTYAEKYFQQARNVSSHSEYFKH
jgi:dynein heavy chain